MAKREAVPRWVIIATLIALAANALASAMTFVTVELMRSMTDFAVMVRERDLRIVHYYQSVAYPAATLAIGIYVWPIIRHFRCDPDQPASELVQRRTVSAPR